MRGERWNAHSVSKNNKCNLAKHVREHKRTKDVDNQLKVWCRDSRSKLRSSSTTEDDGPRYS